MTQIEPATGRPHGTLAQLSLPVLVLSLPPAPVIRFANAAFAEALDTAVDVQGLPLDVLPFDLSEPLARVAASGRSVRHRVRMPGRRATWLLVLDPVEAGDGDAEVVVTAIDVDTVGSSMGQIREDLAAMFDGARGPEELVVQALRVALEVTGGRRAVIYGEDDDGHLVRLAAEAADVGDEEDPGAGMPPDRSVAPPRDLEGPLVSWEVGEGPPPLPWLGRPGWERVLVHTVGRRTGGDALLVVSDPIGGAFAAPEVDQLRLLVSLLATAWRNAELRRDRAALAVMLRGALETSAGLVEPRASENVQQRLLHGLVDRMGLDAAALWVPDAGGEGLELRESYGLPDEVRARVRRLSASSTASRLAQLPVDEEEHPPLPSSSSWPGHVVRLVEVPSPARGVLGVYSRTPLPPLVDGILATLAHAVASAAHLTALHRRAHTVVDALQRELRPHPGDLPDGVDVGWVYESATAGVEVGGDFYDVFPTTDGRVAVVCGDVSGKGIEAASLTAMAVHGLRAYARDGEPTDVVVGELNGMACERTGPERFLTLAYALLDPATGEVELTLAGHPAPVMVGPGGAELVAADADLAVGIVEAATFTRTRLTLDPGCSLVFYTDGVTEARRAGSSTADLLGPEGLLEILRAAGGRDAAGLAASVWDGVQVYTAGGTSDDVAIVVVRRPAA